MNNLERRSVGANSPECRVTGRLAVAQEPVSQATTKTLTYESYFDRREKLVKLLRRGPQRNIDLVRELQWTPGEVRGKLVSLRAEGKVKYDDRTRLWRLS